MKKLIAAAVIAVVLAGAVTAQGKKDHPKDTKALQFGINGLGTFGIGGFSAVQPLVSTLTPVAVGVEYFVSDSMSVGGTLGFVFASTTPAGGTAIGSSAIGLKPTVLVSFLSAGPVELSYGGYLSIGYYGTNAGSSTAFGFGGILTADYFVLPRISLGAEYSVGATFDSNSGMSTNSFGTDALATYLTLYF